MSVFQNIGVQILIGIGFTLCTGFSLFIYLVTSYKREIELSVIQSICISREVEESDDDESENFYFP